MKREQLRIARVTKNLTQGEVGKSLNISAQEYWKIENGRELKLSQAKLLVKLLNIDIDML